MVDKIYIKKVNEVYIEIIASDSIMAELSDHYTAYAKNYKWNPKFRGKKIYNKTTKTYKRVGGGWDGKIRIFNKNKRLSIYWIIT